MSDTATRVQSAVREPSSVTQDSATPVVLSAVAANITSLLQAINAQLHPDTGEFVGRAFVYDAIQTFIHSRNRMLVLTGTPGVGKTAIAIELIRTHLTDAQPFLAHFCSLPNGDNPLQFCLELANQLKASLGDDYKLGAIVGRQLNVVQNVNVGQAGSDTRVVGVEIKELKLGDIHPREAFRALVREPLQAYHMKYGKAPGDVPLMIVIDALDRVWQWDGGQSSNIISVLSDVQDLPPWVNFICTARPGPAVQALRAQAGVRIYDIAATGSENLADIEAFLRERFLGQLDANAFTLLEQVLAASELKDAQPTAIDALITKIVAVSQGNFGYLRRYVGAWRLALNPVAGQLALDPSNLLRFDGLTLDAALDASYAAIYNQVRPALEENAADADQFVLATLAIAFEPLTIPMIARLEGWSGKLSDLADSLVRLSPVLEQAGSGDQQTYAFYHRGFADYIRRNLPLSGRDRDLRAAQALERTDDDLQLQAYAARHRWDHLLRGLDLSATLRTEARDQSTPSVAVELPIDWRGGVARVNEIAPDAVTRAQLLRMLAARALDPSESSVQGSWSVALKYLREAVSVLERSRAIKRLQKRGGRFDGAKPPQEQIELEQTLIALGDAYRIIAQRMDIGGRQYEDWIAARRGLYILWDAFVRLPLTLYLLMVLLTQGVREIHIPGALENLGRGQDWTIARLYVLSVSAYRRVRALVQQRMDIELEDDIVERLARTYMLMGAYDAASSTYEGLLSRPAAINSQWRRAIWLHALGDVLLARRRADRAAEVLSEALQTFKRTEAPVLQARAIGSLALAHMLQAETADTRTDGVRAIDLDDQTLTECNEALTAWQDVTKLQGDESGSVDPYLAVSRIGNLLWRLGRNERLSEEQVRRAQQLRRSIADRHFPQRFEHPLLRLFRMFATVLLPAALILGLMLLVQNPSSFLLSTRTEPALQPPLVDLNVYPNNLISSGTAIPSVLTNSEVTKLISRAGWRQFAPEPPKLTPPPFDLLGVLAIGLLISGGYLLLYLIFGLLFIMIASPAHHQVRRPGRLIVSRDVLRWEGQPALGVWRETWRWSRQELALIAGAARQQFSTLIGLTLDEQHQQQSAQQIIVPLTMIERAVTLDRRERGQLLGDFSFTQIEIQPIDPQTSTPGQHTSLYIPGSLVFYDELCDELTQRLGPTRARRFTVEIIRSVSGAFFFLTLLYIAMLAVLSARAPLQLQQPIPQLGYSLNDLYVLVAPGILLPLLWWFVAQPLAARIVRGRATLALVMTALVSVCLTGAILFGGDRANILRLNPDLFTPTLAIGMLAALTVSALPRPLYRAFRRGHELFGTLLAVAALGCILALTYRVSITIAWYDALVQGNLAIRSGLADSACTQAKQCPDFKQAADRYDRMICLRPGANEGYAFRSLARIAQGQYGAARQDLFDALRTANGDPPTALTGCPQTIVEHASNNTIAALHANLGAASTLQARSQESLALAEPLYQEALYHLKLALQPDQAVVQASQGTSAAPTSESLSCYSLARDLLDLKPDRSEGLSAPDPQALRADQADYMLQLADTCSSLGFTRLLVSASRANRGLVFSQSSLEAISTTDPKNAWYDLMAAVAQYAAVAHSSNDDLKFARAERGKAAAWLILGQIEKLPVGSPSNNTYLLRALTIYRDLQSQEAPDETIYAGQAWSSILLGAWNDAGTPIAEALRLSPRNPTYPALEGLLSWLDGTTYRSATSPEYTNAMNQAVKHYTEAIELSDPPPSEAFATRSLLYYSLRNSPRNEAYTDEDYSYWMHQAISDMDRAILIADQEKRQLSDQVGYRYWRGRLSFNLATTWQRKLRGLHTWAEVVPLYSAALDDFTNAVANDTVTNRRNQYDTLFIPWSRVLLNNAVHLQLAEQAIDAGDYPTARREIELVVPLLSGNKDWDSLTEPRPEYSLLHGSISLALGEPDDFINGQTRTIGAVASYDQAIEDINKNMIVDPKLRAAVYRAAIDDLDMLIKRGLPSSSYKAASTIRLKLARAAIQASDLQQIP